MNTNKFFDLMKCQANANKKPAPFQTQVFVSFIFINVSLLKNRIHIYFPVAVNIFFFCFSQNFLQGFSGI